MTDPTDTWRATFAVRDRTALAETQAALHASQQDLTRVEEERDRFRESYVRDAARLDQAFEDLARIRVERDDARAEAKEWRAIADKYLSQRDEALHDLAHAKFALSMAKARRGEQ